MKKLLTSFSLVVMMLFSTSAFAQMPLGSPAVDFTVTDLNGGTHNLQNYLDDGKVVVIDLFATWCGPCWNFHQTHTLENLWQQYGPNGTDEVVVLGIEGHMGTNLDCIYGPAGCNNTTHGDWTAGVSYPMVSLTTPTLVQDYQLGYWPTVYAICPEGKVYETGTGNLAKFVSYLASCDMESALLSTDDVLCFEDHDGSADIDVTAGAGTIRYKWSNGSTDQDLTNADAGTYSVTATDDNGVFQVLDNVVIDGPTQELSIDNAQANQIDCFGANNGTIDITVVGGTAPYNYSWSNGSTVATIGDLAPDSYQVQVTDMNGCLKDQSFDITEPTDITHSFTSKDEYCDQSDATISVTAAGGTGQITYYLDGAASFSGVFQNLSADDYNVIVKDENNCEKDFQTSITNIPAPELEPVDDIDMTCDEPSLTINTTLAVGNPAFTTYQWSTLDGSIVTGGNTANPVIDKAGVYSVFVNDALTACFTNTLVTVFPDPNSPVAEIAESGNIDCTQDQVVIQGSGSSGSGFNISWTTSDGNIVDGNNTLTPTIDAEGTYELVITTAGGDCETRESITITEDVLEPVLEYQVLHDINCAANTAELLANVDHPRDVTYQWHLPDGSTTDAASVNADEAGQYDLTVIDEVNGCESRAVFQVMEDFEVPVASLTEPMLTCEQSIATIEAQVQTATNSTYLWTTNDGFIISSDQSSAEVNVAGEYLLHVTNNDNGCIVTSSATVTAEEGLPTAIIAAPAAIDCDRRQITLDGSASSAGSGIEYVWTTLDGNIVGNTQSINADVDMGGTYILSVYNSFEDCEAQFSVVVPDERVLPEPAFAAANTYLDVELANMTQDNYDYISWDMGDGFVTNDDITEYTYAEAGTYHVCMTVGIDCGERNICKTVTVEYQTKVKPYATFVPRGLISEVPWIEKELEDANADKRAVESNLQVYPNPASQQIQMVSESDILEFSLKNTNGLEVLRANNVNAKGIQIQVSDFAEGLYFINYKTVNSTGVKKIQIMK